VGELGKYDWWARYIKREHMWIIIILVWNNVPHLKIEIITPTCKIENMRTNHSYMVYIAISLLRSKKGNTKKRIKICVTEIRTCNPLSTSPACYQWAMKTSLTKDLIFIVYIANSAEHFTSNSRNLTHITWGTINDPLSFTTKDCSLLTKYCTITSDTATSLKVKK
jgi:hypothetical protein